MNNSNDLRKIIETLKKNYENSNNEYEKIRSQQLFKIFIGDLSKAEKKDINNYESDFNEMGLIPKK